MSQNVSRFITLFKHLSAATSMMVFLVGWLVLFGWVFDIAAIKSVFPGLASMKVNTALSFVLSGAALFIFTKERENRRIDYWGYACAILVVLIAGLTLLEYMTGWNLRIDQLLFKDASVGTLWPGRMAIATAISFLMSGAALTLLGARRRFELMQALAFIVFITALLAITGYFYGISSLYSIFPYSSVAIHTALTFAVLCFGILWARPEQGLMAMVTSESVAGIMLRRLLPATLILPIAIGWLRLLGQRAGYYGTEFGLALLALSNVIIFTSLAWLTARIIHRLDGERMSAEEALLHAHAKLEMRVEERTAELESVNKQLSIEIVERRQAEDGQRKSDARFEGIIRLADDAIISIDLEQRITMFNQGAERIFGYQVQEVFGQSLDLLLPVQAIDKHHQHIREFVNSTSVSRKMGERQEILYRRKDGSEFPAEATISKIEVSGEMTLTVMLRDITKRKQAGEALRESEKRLLMVLKTLPVGVWVADETGNILMGNEAGQRVWAGARYVGIDQYGEYKGWWADTGKRIEAHEWAMARAVTKGETSVEEVVDIECFDGTRKTILNSAFPLRDQNQKINGAIVINEDITARLRAEDSLKKSLEEKELLLKEIHHRVKNNLQVIWSLLNLQSGFIQDRQILEMFRDSQNRIHSMALVHELLYQSEDLAKIDFAAYIQSLVNDLLMSYGASDQAIHTNIEIEPFQMNVDRAIPCGLIINELVSNALKHAFPDDREGRIEISLRQEGAQNLALSVRDNGKGLPAELDLQQTKTLGLQLVNSLCRQLQGSLEIHNTNGTEFRVIFPALITKDV